MEMHWPTLSEQQVQLDPTPQLKLILTGFRNLTRIRHSYFVLLGALDFVPEDLAALGVVGEQMVNNHLLRRLSHPLEQREISELIGAENLEHLDRLVANVLYKVAHIPGHDADITRHVVECASGTFRSKYGDASAPLDEEGPLVSVGMPVHFPNRSWLDGDVGGGHGLGDREVFGVSDADLSPACLLGFLVHHFVGELEL